jgi:hypothetical protein
MKWDLIARPEPRGTGQRFFKKTESVYVCDNSGPNPDRSDDGPLRLLTDRPIIVAVHDRVIYCSAKVRVERTDQIATVGLTTKEASWCISELKMTVELDGNARQLLNLMNAGA